MTGRRELRVVQLAQMQQLSPQVSTAQLSDALDSLGFRDQVLAGRFVPLTREARAVGRAATLRFEIVDHDVEEPYDAAIAFIDALEPGSLVLIATGGSERSAYWGELFSCAAIGRGATGVVCDSYLRDSPKVAELGFPAFARGARPIDYRARMEITSVNRPVSCAGVRVAPGELILADADGVVVVPEAIEAEAIRRANERAQRETNVLDELRAGATLRSVWDRYRVL